MMNDPSISGPDHSLRLPRAGAGVAVVTAKDKLRRLAWRRRERNCLSIEASGVEVYSAELASAADGAYLGSVSRI